MPGVLVVVLAGAVVAACGTSGTASAPTTTAPPHDGVVKAATLPHYGTVLVDSSGHTLYAYSLDTAASLHCTGSCTLSWRPLLTKGPPRAGSGVSSSLLSTVRRGRLDQVVYAGHPLYTYVADAEPGETRGQDVVFLGVWQMVAPSGQFVTTSPPRQSYPVPTLPRR